MPIDFSTYSTMLYPDNGGAPGKGKDYGFGTRPDGSYKGPGFMGELKRPDGGISTELSIDVELDGKDVAMPLLVPTLTKKEIEHLLNDGAPTDDIVDKAVAHAKLRMKDGKSPFFGQEDE